MVLPATSELDVVRLLLATFVTAVGSTVALLKKGLSGHWAPGR